METLEALRGNVLKSFQEASDLVDLEQARIAAFGKKGFLTLRMKILGTLEPEEKRQAGKDLNILKTELTKAYEARRTDLENNDINTRLNEESIDVTLPIRPDITGRIHPISQVLDEMIEIFGHMGFSIVEGPDIEDDFHNFTALNIPPEHPARQMHDTFYFPEQEDGSRLLLRTHTSPVQIRTMKKDKPPYRIIAPGRTYRCDYDYSHTPMFHQIEGLVVDKETHMGHLKGCLIDFVQSFFEIENLPVRFRPSYFPFTEPSAEMDIGCSREDGVLKIGAGEDWMEILGCGMVNPRVLETSGLDPNIYQGFAFGLGVERAAMLKYGIPDLRTFYEADWRWIRHYGFQPHMVPGMVSGLTK